MVGLLIRYKTSLLVIKGLIPLIDEQNKVNVCCNEKVLGLTANIKEEVNIGRQKRAR